jgi:hypothetical protein
MIQTFENGNPFIWYIIRKLTIRFNIILFFILIQYFAFIYQQILFFKYLQIIKIFFNIYWLLFYKEIVENQLNLFSWGLLVAREMSKENSVHKKHLNRRNCSFSHKNHDAIYCSYAQNLVLRKLLRASKSFFETYIVHAVFDVLSNGLL